MKSDRLLLGLDLGTTNVKAVVTDFGGRVLSAGSALVPLRHVEAGGVEQDIEEIFQAALEVLRQAAGGVEAARIAALGVSSQGGALQILDAQGRSAKPVISWLDCRGATYDDALTAELGGPWFAQRVGHGRSGVAVGQLLRLRHDAAGLLDPPHRIGFVGDTIVGRLCGHAAHDGTSCGIAVLYNPWRRGYDMDVLQRLGMPATQLPDLLSPRTSAGRLRPEIAQAAGLPAAIPVSAAVHDQYAAALGTGAVRPGDVLFGAGTAWVLLAVSDQPAPPVLADAFACTHVVEGLYGQLLSLFNGGSAFAWTRGLLGLDKAAPEELDRLMASVPAGSDGLCFWPLLVSGVAGLEPGAKGRLLGLQLCHRAEHVLRAVVEGLAYELARHLRFLLGAGIRLDRLIMSGKASAGTVTPQILADVSGLPIACTVHSEASALGAAIIARGLIEPGVPLDQLAESMTLPARLVAPGKDAAVYQAGLQQYLESLPWRPSASSPAQGGE